MEPLLRSDESRKSVSSALIEKAKSLGNGRFVGVFCGLSDVFFSVEPSKGVLIDARKPIIAFYEAVQREPDAVYDEVQRLLGQPFNEKTFNQIRSKWNGKDFGVLFAAKFLYLNRTSLLGSFSVDLGQRFSASWGGLSSPPSFPTLDELRSASSALRNVRLYTNDYAYVLRACRKGDLVYVDLPSWGIAVPYGGSVFSEDDHARIGRLLRKASNRGVNVIASNLDCEAIRMIYGTWSDIEVIDDWAVISAAGSYFDRKQMSLF